MKDEIIKVIAITENGKTYYFSENCQPTQVNKTAKIETIEMKLSDYLRLPATI